MTIKNTVKCRKEKISFAISPIFELVKEILYSRPNVTVLLQLMKILSDLSESKGFLDKLCEKNDKKIIIDYSQGVSVYNHGEYFFLSVLSNMIIFVTYCRNMFHTSTFKPSGSYISAK